MTKMTKSEMQDQVSQSFREQQRMEDDRVDEINSRTTESLLEQVLEQLVELNRNVERLASRVNQGHLG